MSGFIAVLHTDNAPVNGALLQEMTAAMAYRGPDGQQTWSGDRVGLGHALFRTTFESAREVQPSGLDGVWISADAHIHGRAALLRALRTEAGRDVANDAPDGELVLHAYLAWGDAGLGRLIGDFAFVLWDGRRQRLLAARDQFGVAQLFWARVGATVLIGNTLASLLRHPGVPATLDEQALADAALFTVSLDDSATAYTAVRRVPPGHKVVWDGGRLRVEQYWMGPRVTPIRYRRAEDYADHFRAIFDEAVGDRLRTDRVGCQLSGGMDSTSIAVTAHRSGVDVRAYSLDYGSLLPDDEAVLAAAVGGHAGFPVEVVAGEPHLGRVPDPVSDWVPPEPGPVNLGQMAEVCDRAAASSPVLLTGYGGDPLLAPPALSWRRAGAAVREGAWTWPARQAVVRGRERALAHRPDPLPAWVDRGWARRMDLADRVVLHRRRSRREQTGLVEAPLWRALFAWSDAGYHGRRLDIRFPFFDVRLLEFVLAIPPVPWLEGKRVLRDAMSGRLPEQVRTRPKTLMAGDVAMGHNVVHGVPGWELDALAGLKARGYLDGGWLRSVRAQPIAEQARTWAEQRPPVHLASWLQQRRSFDKGERCADVNQ